MNRPIIQIVIPVYNSEKYLRRCLDSVKGQTFSQWQAVIVDDGSSDSSGKIINEYVSSDERFVYIRQDNAGASAARNTALDRLNGEYTAFLDSDDYWECDMLESLYESANKHDADVVQCRYCYDYTGGKQSTPKGAFSADVVLEGEALKKVYLRMMTGINMNHVCMKLIKTSLIDTLRFNTDLKTAEDLHFCVRLFKKVKKYCFIDRALYHYCRNEDSITGKGLPFSVRLNANRCVSKEMAKALPEWNIDTPFYRVLTYLRPYTIIGSKVFRIIKEKLAAEK